METVFRGLSVYVFLLVILRLSGRRTLGQTTTFDFVLLLIIAETTQQALLGDDFSITNAFILITTLVGADILLSLLKLRSPYLERLVDGLPLVVVEEGRPLHTRMRKSRIDEQDVLAAARKNAWAGAHGPDQIRRAGSEWRYQHHPEGLKAERSLSRPVIFSATHASDLPCRPSPASLPPQAV